MKDTVGQRVHITRVLLTMVLQSQDSRASDLNEYLDVVLPQGDNMEMAQIVSQAPSLISTLHAKWIDMFIERLQETASPQHVELLCDNTSGNNAALLLAYTMFLESERMEQIVEQDIHGMMTANFAESALCDSIGAQLRNYLIRRKTS